MVSVSTVDVRRKQSSALVVPVLAFAGIVVALMQTLIVPVVPRLPALVNASASDTAWAVTATLLASAVAVPITGRLGDMYGKKKLLLVSLALLVAGSVIAALSSTLAPLVVGRAFQGLSAGVIPLGISVMRDVLPAGRLAGAVAMMSASIGIGSAFGLPVAALIADHADWHVLFWTSAVLGVFVALLVVVLVPESSIRTGGSFDFAGAISLSFALVAFLLSISKGGDWGWGSAETIGLLLTALAAAVVWVFWGTRASRPLVDIRLAGHRQVLLTNLASIAFGFALFVMALVFPQIIQLPEYTGYGLGQSMLVAGLAIAPCGAVMMMVAPLSSRITSNRGPKLTLIIGALLVGVGYGIGVAFMHSVEQMVVIAMVIGAGTGLGYGAIPTLIMSAVPPSETGAANSFNTLMRSLGTSVASAVAGAVLARMATSYGSTVVPTEVAFQVLMVGGAASAVVALIFAAFLPRARIGKGPETRFEPTRGVGATFSALS